MEQYVSKNPVVNFLAVQLKRLIVLAVGAFLSFFVSWQLFPILDNRTPLLIALFLTYIITAYVLLPLAIRVANSFFRPRHVPHYTVTPDGFANDPVNISFVGTRHQIITAMKKAGWYEADPRTLKNMVRVVRAYILKEDYSTAPFSNLYLFGRNQDLAFQKKVTGSVTHRHHFRLWGCTNLSNPKFREHVSFWRLKHKALNKNQRLLWVGSAIQDEGLGIIRYTGQLTHGVVPNTNAERDMIVADLEKSGVLKEVRTIRAGEPTIRDNRVIGDEMIADGELKVCIIA